jgi:competence protein ComEC
VSVDLARPTLRFLNEALILTLAAQVLTIPLVVTHFGRLSLVAPLANLLILPVQPPIMALGGTAALTSLVPALEPLARALAWLPWLCLAYTNAVVRWLAGWSFASLEIDRQHVGLLLAAYAAILTVLWLWSQRRDAARRLWTSLTTRRSTTLMLGGPLAVALLAWLALLQLPDGKLHVTFLNVGQGDAVLITTPGGGQILVDGGPSPNALTTALGREMPFWDRSLDLLVMTHAEADHITGLTELLERFEVDGWLDNGLPDDDPLYVECQRLLAEKGVPRHVAHRGDVVELGGGVALQVLHPPPEVQPTGAADNNQSLVLRLDWGAASFLLTGDVEAEAEHLLVRSGQPLAADVLKVAHHGSGGSTTEEFLTSADPLYAVISVGAENRFGHPAEAVLRRLGRWGDLTVLRTDEVGTIEFVSDGRRLWIGTER